MSSAVGGGIVLVSGGTAGFLRWRVTGACRTRDRFASGLEKGGLGAPKFTACRKWLATALIGGGRIFFGVFEGPRRWDRDRGALIGEGGFG